MNIEIIKNKVAVSKGYGNWEEMENFIIDHNSSVNAVILIRSAMDEVALLFAENAFNDATEHQFKSIYNHKVFDPKFDCNYSFEHYLAK